MKSFSIPLLALLLSAKLASDIHAQSFSIDWFTIAGGGTSTGSVYSPSPSPPPAARRWPAAITSLTGGFWALYMVQTAGAPLLTISRTDNVVMIFCSSTSKNWMLQQNANLSGTN
jgi:hypothetical protein